MTRGKGLLALKTKVGSDDFQTPEWPIKTLLEHIKLPLDKVILEPACGKGLMVATLNVCGYDVIGSDLKEGVNFITDDIIVPYDVVITNPPYSVKDAFIERCYELGKPFALLLPLTALEGIKRQALYREHGMQLICLPRRVNYHTPSGTGSGAWFPSAWFTNGFNLPNDLTFAE